MASILHNKCMTRPVHLDSTSTRQFVKSALSHHCANLCHTLPPPSCGIYVGNTDIGHCSMRIQFKQSGGCILTNFSLMMSNASTKHSTPDTTIRLNMHTLNKL